MRDKKIVIYVVDLEGNEYGVYSYTFTLRKTYQLSDGDYPFDENTVYLTKDDDGCFRFRVFEGTNKVRGDMDASCTVPGILDNKYFISDSKELAEAIFRLVKENVQLRYEITQHRNTIKDLRKCIIKLFCEKNNIDCDLLGLDEF